MSTNGSGARVELLTIGTELLLGQVVDTNASWMGRRLAELGIVVTRKTSVGDAAEVIRDAVARALERTGFVLCTGGLGPTADDVTRPAVAELYGRDLVQDPVWLETLRRRSEARGRAFAAPNAKQADVPVGGRMLPNRVGTAPGLILEDARGTTVLLPGVPNELRVLFEEEVLPYLVERHMTGGPPIRQRTLRTTGITESEVAARLDGIEGRVAPISVAYLPTWDGVDVRLIDWHGEPARLAAAVRKVRRRIGAYVYGLDHRDLAQAVGDLLRRKGLTLAMAESCTGGLIAKRLTDTPGASQFLIESFVTYANEAKVRALRVPSDLLQSHGAVSGQVARAMARGARRCARSDVALAVTGIAGPDGGTVEKPVGTVWIALSLPGRTAARLYRFSGDRAEIRARASQAALAWLWRTARRPIAGRSA